MIRKEPAPQVMRGVRRFPASVKPSVESGRVA